MMIGSTNMLAVAEIVAREKNIESSHVLEAMEQAIQRAGRSKYGMEHDIRAHIDRKSGEVKLARYIEVVEEIENAMTQMTPAQAKENGYAETLGAFIIDPLPPIDFGRIAAQTAKQVIVQKVREAERERQYEEYKDRVGEIVNGTIKRVEYGNLTVDLGRAEAMLRRDELIPREHFKRGDRIRAYIFEVRQEQRAPQIFLSRTHPQFMAKLFAQEVPEIYDGIITIKAVVRDPGSRAKIVVMSSDSSIDPVGACVGMRGSRVQAVVAELQGEKVDIINWTEDRGALIVKALAPAEVSKVVLDEDRGKIEVVVPDDHLSLAIGRRGQNVRLASSLIGSDIDIMTEEQESEKRQAEFNRRSQRFIDGLNVDDVIARLLVAEGFSHIEEVAYVPVEDLVTIEGFDEDVAGELQYRATQFLEEENRRQTERLEQLKMAEDLLNFDSLDLPMLVALGEAGVLSLDDFADLAADELINAEDGILRDFSIKPTVADDFIMLARVNAGWFSAEMAAEIMEKRKIQQENSDMAAAKTRLVEAISSPSEAQIDTAILDAEQYFQKS